MLNPRFLNLGDSALTIEFGNDIDKDLVLKVASMDDCLTKAKENGSLNGVVETIPTFRSLTVVFDPVLISKKTLKSQIMDLLKSFDMTASPESNRWLLPVLYGGEYGPDLETVAECKNLTAERVIELHTSQLYTVYMIGFLPGFPFMGDVVPEIHMPRRTEPRVIVPAGSVAITGQQTAVYPWESPGGWQLLGRCPLNLFDAELVSPTLLSPGDQVGFQAISSDRFNELLEQKKAGLLDMEQFKITGSRL